MAARKTLKSRIDTLFSSLGGPVEKRPSLDKIRSQLASFALMAEALENGEATREAEEKIASLEAALEQSEAAREQTNVALEQSESQNTEFRAALQAVNTEIERLLEERRKQQEEERNREIPPKQLDILRRLPSKHGGLGLTVPQIWREVKGRLDELEIHIAKLDKAGLIEWHMEADGDKFWRRTMPGNELIVAKRLAGEEEEKQPQRKHDNRSEIEEDVMKALAMLGPMACDEFSENTRISADRAEVALYDLEKAGFAKIVKPEEVGEAKYDLSIEGVRYLLERDFLD